MAKNKYKMSLFLKKHKRKLRWFFIGVTCTFFIWYAGCLPKNLFNTTTATVLLDSKGALLGAQIAADGQWRFEAGDSVPFKFKTCLVQFEDRSFYDHIGISLRGIGRSVVQNVKHKRIVSGGSTLTMQLVRIMKKNPRRTFGEKILEMIMATRLEIRYSKKEILSYYAANAPFGNNVVGLEAASWRYFGRSPDKLSWSESATLAVLPNAPGLIYPGRNHDRLLQKRNRLLKRLYNIGIIDETTWQLAISEPLPVKPLPLPRYTPHLLMRLVKEGHKGHTVYSTIDLALQKKAQELLQQHHIQMRENRIFNGSVMVTSVKTGQVLVYIGNTENQDAEHGSDVDCILAERSTGSILKPFLYAKAMEDGIINPKTLLLDVPTHFGSFAPANFSKQYDGAVPANQSLSRSLNVPFVRLLNDYGLEKFHYELKSLGIKTLVKPARHYGLSLILGGAEARLWDLNRAYACMAQSLAYHKMSGVGFIREEINADKIKSIDKACIHAMFEAMVEVNRPDEDGNWRAFSGSQKIAWKTGTSFGFRDAWAIGVTPEYVISVWIGNGDGEGRPGLTGIKAAAPLMFNLFSILPKAETWFQKPVRGVSSIQICRESGYRAGSLCKNAVLSEVPATCLRSTVCPYHQLVHLNKSGTKRVDMECEKANNITHVPWFILPPGVEKYYKFNHPDYRILPEFKAGCISGSSDRPMAILYPKPGSRIYVPVEIDGNKGKTIFEATHRNTDLKIFWHLDNEYLGETREIHQLALNPALGRHKLTLVDEYGISQEIRFEVVGKNSL
jgi:penicillin-binding protein 1C